MSGAVTATGLLTGLLLIFCVLAETAQQLSFKVGVSRIGEHEGAALGAVRQPLVWAGIFIWLVESIAWVWVLQRAPLTVAYPVMTLSYVGVPLAGVVLLGEKLSTRQVAGAALIVFGVLCVGLSGVAA